MGTMKEKRSLSLEEAMDQTASYYGFDVQDDILIETPSGPETFSIRYREFLDEPTRRAVNECYARYNSCDREKVVIPSGDPAVPPIEIPGAYKEPRLLNDKPFDLDIEICKAIWGEEKYQRWADAGGPPGLIQITWNRMRHQFGKRLSSDSKSS